MKGAVEGLGLVAMAQAFGDTYKVRLHVDASAALGIVQRKGVDKCVICTQARCGFRNSRCATR